MAAHSGGDGEICLAENPLLPNDQLRALYARLKRCIALDQKSERKASQAGRSTTPPSRAALVAACTLQLTAGDLLVAPGADTALQALAPSAEPNMSLPSFAAKDAPLALLAAALAAGVRSAGSESLIFCYVPAGVEQAEWATALAWAQSARLPLVIACADPSGFNAPVSSSSKMSNAAWTWPNVRKQANLLQLPVLTVDGEDAVAVYRCMQEAVLRARAGGGPAILWATLPSARELRRPRTAAQQPLGRLRDYLRTRKIPLRSAT